MVEMLITVGAAVLVVDLFSYQFKGEREKKTENMCNLTNTQFCHTHYILDYIITQLVYK